MLQGWPSDRMSWRGLVECVLACACLPLGVFTLRHASRDLMSPLPSTVPLLILGFAALVVCGLCLFWIVRRREYPWLVAFAAVALPLFEPSRAPYRTGDRVVMGVRDLVLVGAAVLFLVRVIAKGDELERRTHLEALSWSYATVVVVLVILALVEDVLPPLRGTWIASAMLATWFVAWLVASRHYQR